MLLMFSVLCADPEVRATIKDIETNEWVTQPVDMSKFAWNSVLRNTEFHSNSAGEVQTREDELKELKYAGGGDENRPVEASAATEFLEKPNPIDLFPTKAITPAEKLYLLSKSF